MTDSPNVMVKMRNDLHKELNHIVPIRCPLHALNLITQDIALSTKIKPITDKLSRLVSYFLNSSFWSNKLKEWRQKVGITTFLKLKMDTRWYTFTAMCESVYIFKNGFKELLNVPTPDEDEDVEEEGKEAIKPPELPSDIIKIIKSSIFDDVFFSIGVLEERTAHLGLIWQEFIKIHRFIQEKIDDQENNRLPDLYKNTINLLKTRFNKRAKDFDEPIYLVSIFLTPEFRKIACGGKYNFNDYTNMIVDLAINWNFSFNDSVKIGNQLQSYFENIDPHYGWESDPVKYWQSMKKHPELAKFALMVFAIYPSSGKVERLFSIMSCTKTKKRNNLSKDTVTDIAKIK